MKVNEHTAIIGKDVILVPYRHEHVEKYHQWMLDEELRELTASEPLSLDEEYEMQRKWRSDEDKLTFIILANEGGITASPMVGDVNMFFKGTAADDDFEVEVEIMIAEKPYRRKGLASSALQLMLRYATSTKSSSLPVHPKHLVVRIGDKNVPSINMFRKLGFAVTKHVEVFSEIEMRLEDPRIEPSKVWFGGEAVEYRTEADVTSA